MATIDVKDADGLRVAIEKPLVPSRAAAAVSRPVVLSVEDKAALDLLARTRSIATATIANGASLSGAVDLSAGRLVQIQMPAAWTAANLTFQTSFDGVTYADLYDATGAEYVIVAAVSQSIVIPRNDFVGTRYLKARSGPAAAPVNQGGSRDISLVLVS